VELVDIVDAFEVNPVRVVIEHADKATRTGCGVVPAGRMPPHSGRTHASPLMQIRDLPARWHQIQLW
jgi:hypothetical protein